MTMFTFFTEEQRREYEAAFGPHQASGGPAIGQPSSSKHKLPTKVEKGKNRADPLIYMDEGNEKQEPDDDEEMSDHTYMHEWLRNPPSPPSSPEPRIPRMAAPASFSAPLRTSMDMPIRGSREAPKTFKGKHTEVLHFIQHYDRLLSKCRVTDDKEKCEYILEYCSADVQNVVQAMDSFPKNKWTRLRKEILKFYDAERAAQKYKPSDVVAYTLKSKNHPCYNLTQWRKYFVKYNSIAGGPYHRGHLSKDNYLGYFWLGIHSTLRQILENRILQQRSQHDNSQYSMNEINGAAEWYFRRNKFESLIVNAAEYGIDIDDEYSGDDSDNESSSSEESESDYEEFKRKKKLRERKKKHERKQKQAAKESGSRNQMKFGGNEDEIASMIKKLNSMKIDDPDYAPVYYRVMVLDKTGTASKCVKAPKINDDEELPPRTYSRPQQKTFAGPVPINNTENSSPKTPATYPNNIPIGERNIGNYTNPVDRGCFGCNEMGHRIFECKQVAGLIQKNIIAFNEETRRLEMKNGSNIRRNPGENLVQAAERISASNTPRVMLNYLDPTTPMMRTVQGFYQEESKRARIVEVYTDSSEDENDAGTSEVAEEPESSDNEAQEVYLTIPRGRKLKNQEPAVQTADRTVPSTRTARKQVFDGVYPPVRDKSKTPPIKDLQSQTDQPTSAVKKPAEVILTKPRPHAAKNTVPELVPIDARKVRFDVPMEEDVEMKDIQIDKPSPKTSSKEGDPSKKDIEKKKDMVELHRGAGRQSAISGTVNKRDIAERILDLPFIMTIREVMDTSKEVRNEFQDLIRVKNVKAVFLGHSTNHPVLTNLGWPRTDGVLIKIEMETAGQTVCAIIDTGSQLNVARSDIAAIKIKRTVDMSYVTNMNDANGGRGQLQGWIENVDFNCGGAKTNADLWVSQSAPFELLLGRPWQRGNLVSIDEREEGTYLVFKDNETRRPRYELLAIPYDGSTGDFQSGNHMHYQSFTYLNDAPDNFQGKETAEKGLGLQRTEMFLSNGAETSQQGNNYTRKGTGYSAPQLPSLEQELRGLAIAGLRLVRVSLGLMTVAGGWVITHLTEKLQINIAQKQHKRLETGKEGRYEPNRTHSEDMAIPTKTINLPHSPPRPRVAAFERIQYLSRDYLHHPGPPDAEFPVDSPETAIQQAVKMEWDNYIQRRPLTVRPAFTASPQSIYLGSTQGNDGQVIHDSVNLNAVQTLYNSSDGQPCTLHGHSFSRFIQTPLTASALWALEVPYPSDVRIQEAMDRFTSLDHQPDVLGHEVPSTISAAHTTPAQMVSEETIVSSPPKTCSHSYHDEQVYPQAKNALSSDTTSQVQAQKTSKDEPQDGGYSIIFAATAPTRSETPDSLPDLQSIASSNSDSESVFVYKVAEPCTACMGPQHSNISDCPGWQLPDNPSDDTPGMLDPISVCLTNGALTYHTGKTQTATTEATPTLPPLQLGFTPIINQLPSIPTLATREQVIIQNLRQLLGLDPTEPENLVKMREIAHVAELQAHQAVETFTRKLEEYKTSTSHAEAANHSTYVAKPPLSTLMTNALLTNRPSFDLGLGQRTDSGGGRKEEGKEADDRADQVGASDSEQQCRIRIGAKARGPMILDDESLPTPPLSSLDWSTLSSGVLSAVLSPDASNPGSPTSERSVNYDFDVYNPRQIIDDAIRRVLANPPAKQIIYSTSTSNASNEEFSLPFIVPDHGDAPSSTDSAEPPVSSTDPFSSDIDDDSSSTGTAEFLERLTYITGFPPSYQNHDETDNSMGAAVFQWVENQMEREELTHRWDAGFGGQPWKAAKNTAFEGLHHLLDLPQMAADNLQDLTRHVANYTTMYGTLPPDHSNSGSDSSVSNTSPDPTHSPTSLDFTLETPDAEVSSHPLSMSEIINEEAISDEEDLGDKRKPSGSGTSSVERPRKRFRKSDRDALRRKVIHHEAIKASHLTEPGTLSQLAFVRQAMLEGAQRVEDILVREKCDFRAARHEYYAENGWFLDLHNNTHRFSNGRPRHSLLSDTETAKFQVLGIILRQRHYYDLAYLINDLLRIRFKDDYAISHLLGAGYLDFLSPGGTDLDPELYGIPTPDSSDMEGMELEYSESGDENDIPSREAFRSNEIPDTTQAAAEASDDSDSPPRPLFVVPPSVLRRGHAGRQEIVGN